MIELLFKSIFLLLNVYKIDNHIIIIKEEIYTLKLKTLYL